MTSDPSGPTKSGEQSLVRTLLVADKILVALGEARSAVPLSELARTLGMTPPRVHRHLATLAAIGHVERTDGDPPLYALGWRLVHLGERAVHQHDLGELARPHLRALSDTVGHGVILSRLINSRLIVWEGIEGPVSPHITFAPGTHLPLKATASGRCALAFMPAEPQAQAIARPLGPHDGPDPISDAKALAARLEEIRGRFHDLQGVDVRGCMFGIAAPVFDSSNAAIATVTAVGLASGDRKQTDAIVRAVMSAAKTISDRLASTAYDGQDT